MKTRLLWIAIAAVGLAALYFGIARPHVSTLPRHVQESVVDLKPPALPPLEPPVLIVPPTPTIALPPLRPVARPAPVPGRLEVPIQDGATIDFSTGAPVVRVQGKDQDALDAALREIAEATKDVSLKATK